MHHARRPYARLSITDELLDHLGRQRLLRAEGEVPHVPEQQEARRRAAGRLGFGFGLGLGLGLGLGFGLGLGWSATTLLLLGY